MLKYIIGFAAVLAIVASASVSSAGCHEVVKDKFEVCLKSTAHYPCIDVDPDPYIDDLQCFNGVTGEEIGDCRVWLQQMPCNDPECKEPFIDVEVDCCCFTPAEPKAME